MNVQAQTLTVAAILPLSVRKGALTAQAAYDLAVLSRRNLSYGDFLRMPVRLPSVSMVELVKRDQMQAENFGYYVPAVELMREGIREGLSCGPTGNGNRFRRRLEALNMGARRRISNPRGWDVVDTSCPDCVPAAPVSSLHLNIA